MVEIERRLDKLLSKSARLFYRNRLKTLFFMLLMVVMLGSHLLQIEINTATEGYLNKDHTELVSFKKIIDQFGRGMQDLCIAVEAPDIFDLKFLNKLKLFS